MSPLLSHLRHHEHLHVIVFYETCTQILDLLRSLQRERGMALVLMVGTLNRVMIVELKVPATLVAFMLALPLVFAPYTAGVKRIIGFFTRVLG